MPIILNKVRKNTLPLDRMSNQQLESYIDDFLDDWPVRLSVSERLDAFRLLWNSVISMQLRCMTQEERDAYYAGKRKRIEIKAQVDRRIKDRHDRLKVHVIDV